MSKAPKNIKYKNLGVPRELMRYLRNKKETYKPTTK